MLSFNKWILSLDNIDLSDKCMINQQPRTWVTLLTCAPDLCSSCNFSREFFFIYASKIAFCFEFLLNWKDSRQQSILQASQSIFAHERFYSKVLFGFEYIIKKKMQTITTFFILLIFCTLELATIFTTKKKVICIAWMHFQRI